MNAAELYRAGRLDEAVEAVSLALRADPTDSKRRTFLFELLCFAGSLERAERQLDILCQGSQDAEMGGLLYRSALHAERTRREMFAGDGLAFAGPAPRPVAVTLNGTSFDAFRDADPRLGARLELFVAGQYTWLPLEQIESVSLEPPRRLRDLLWIPAVVRPAEAFRQLELGEVLLPVLTASAGQHPDPAVRLGRVTEWEALDDERDVPVGQKLWLADDEEIPFLEVRELVIAPSMAIP
jgi:type VI secretion system protein ImpE